MSEAADRTQAAITFLAKFKLQPKKVIDGTQVQSDCPFCGKEGHLFVDPKDFLWDCKVCGKAGNAITFFTLIAQTWPKTHTPSLLNWKELSMARGGVPAKYFQRVGAILVHGVWVLPSWSENGTVRDLRWWVNKKRLFSTPGCKIQLFGARELAEDKSDAPVWVCEGEWDAIAAMWLLETADMPGIVVGVPGANTLKSDWLEMFSGREIITFYDNDDAGAVGRERCEKVLGNVCKKMHHVVWPSTLKSGYDLRDHITANMKTKKPAQVFADLMKLAVPFEKKVVGKSKALTEKVDPITWEQLLEAFKSKLLMTPDMINGLKVCVAAIMSAPLPGDPLWVYLVGPPGAGKTAILASMGTSPKCVLRSSLTAHSLVSGWKGEQGDPSLIPLLANLGLVCKDFTEVLSQPSIMQDEIFSTLRGAYDGSVVKQFGNGVQREYTDCRFAFVAGVTQAVHACKTATLGERFLKFQIERQHGDDADALVRAAMLSVGKEKALEETLQNAMLAFLERVPEIGMLPDLPESIAKRLIATVQLVAFLRAKVDRDPRSDLVQYRPVPEAGTRLAKQLAKMAMMLAFVDGRKVVSEDDYKLVERIARDTAGGFMLDVVNALEACGGEATRSDIEGKADMPHGTVYKYLEDMQVLGILRVSGQLPSAAGKPAFTFKLTPEVHRLWVLSKGENVTPNKVKPKKLLTLKRKLS
jgi:hypothetical protein